MKPLLSVKSNVACSMHEFINLWGTRVDEYKNNALKKVHLFRTLATFWRAKDNSLHDSLSSCFDIDKLIEKCFPEETLSCGVKCQQWCPAPLNSLLDFLGVAHLIVERVLLYTDSSFFESILKSGCHKKHRAPALLLQHVFFMLRDCIHLAQSLCAVLYKQA